MQQGHPTVPPAGETALSGHKREQVEGFAHIPAELLAGEDGDCEDFTVCDFGLWVVAMVEYGVADIRGARGRCDSLPPATCC